MSILESSPRAGWVEGNRDQPQYAQEDAVVTEMEQVNPNRFFPHLKKAMPSPDQTWKVFGHNIAQ